MYRNGQQFRAGIGLTTMHPTADWETYSEAGYEWNPHTNKWQSLPGLGTQSRGLKVVGSYNYITHPTFRPLSLAFNLLDGLGTRRWVPPDDLRPIRPGECNPIDSDPRHPWPFIAYYSDPNNLLEAFNIGFEAQVINLFCVPVWGWPVLRPEQERCCMAKARASAYPGKLEDLGDVLDIVNKKDPMGDKLIRKLTVPKNPGGYYKPLDVLPPAPRYPRHVARQKPIAELLAPREKYVATGAPSKYSGEFDDDIPF